MALRGTTGVTGNDSALSITYSGTAIQTGDLIILATIQENSGGAGGTFTDPTGFTAGGSLSPAIPDVNDTTNGMNYHVAVKIAGAGDTGTPTYATTSTVAQPYVQQIRVYSGRNNTSVATSFNNQVATAVSAAETSSPFTYNMTGLTALGGDDIVVFVPVAPQGGGVGQTYDTALTGYANELATRDTTNQFTPGMNSIDHANASAGATGTLGVVVTVTGGTATNLVVYGFVFSLPKAAAAGGGGSPLLLLGV